MGRLSLIICAISCVIVVGFGSVVPDHSQWAADDPRWETLLPNWWDDENFKPPKGPAVENSKAFWTSQGQNTLKQKLTQQNLNLNRAKNVIIMIGAGMGLSSQMAARSYMSDVSTELAFEKFPHSGMSKVYCVNYQVPDSAASTTAMMGGVKNNFMVIGLTSDVNLRNCSASKNEDVKIPSIFKYAQDAGKSTGFVTTTKVTDSTVAATYAHAASMQWQNDATTPDGCDDIGKQLIHGQVGSKLDVVLGGGLGNLMPDSLGGKRKDGVNLVDDYKNQHKKSAVVLDKEQLMSVNPQTTDKLLGLFAGGHMDFKLLANDETQPTLTEMTAKALEMMKKNQKNGYMLMVEGGRIDRAHHENQAHLALEEVVEFHKAVEYVKQNTNEEDTLVIVTADHGQPFTVGGYLPRGRNVLGPGDWSIEDKKWVFSVNYAQGQGYKDHFDTTTNTRKNIQGMQYMEPTFRYPSGVLMDETTHTGEDVGVYAQGPYSHLFTGVYEQSFIAHAMMYASCLGPNDVMKNPMCDKM